MELLSFFRRANKLPISSKITTTPVPHGKEPFVSTRYTMETKNSGKTWIPAVETTNHQHGITTKVTDAPIPFSLDKVIEYMAEKEMHSLRQLGGYSHFPLTPPQAYMTGALSIEHKTMQVIRENKSQIDDDDYHITKAIRDFERTNPPVNTPNAITLKRTMIRAQELGIIKQAEIPTEIAHTPRWIG